MPYIGRDPYLDDPRDPFVGDEDDFFPYRPVMASAPASPGWENRNGMIEPAPNMTTPQPPPQRNAMMDLAELQAKRPLQSEHKASGLRKTLGAIAGGLQGAGEGYMAVRGFRTPQGPNIGEAIVNAPYKRAMQDYGDQEDALIRKAQMEQQMAEQQRRGAESQARIATSNKQQSLYDRQIRKLDEPKPVTPIRPVVVGGELRDPTTGATIGPKATPKPDPLPNNLTQEVALINRDSQLDAGGKKVAIQAAIDRWNQTHPRAPQWRAITDAAGNVSAVTMSSDGVPTVKRVGDKPIGRPVATRAGGRSMTPGQQATADAKKRANELIQQHGGVDQALANAGTEPIDVQNALADAKRKSSLATGGGSQKDRIRAMLRGDKKSPTKPNKKIQIDLSQFER